MAANMILHETSLLDANSKSTKEVSRGGTFVGTTDATRYLDSQGGNKILVTGGDNESSVLQMTYAEDSLQSSHVNNSLVSQGLLNKLAPTARSSENPIIGNSKKTKGSDRFHSGKVAFDKSIVLSNQQRVNSSTNQINTPSGGNRRLKGTNSEIG